MLAARDQDSALEDYLGTLFAPGALGAAAAAESANDAPVVTAAARANAPLRVVRFCVGSMSFALPSDAVKRVVPLREVTFVPRAGIATMAAWHGQAFHVVDLLALVVPAAHPQRKSLLAAQNSQLMLVLDAGWTEHGGYAVLCDSWSGDSNVAPDQLCPHTDTRSYRWLTATFADGSGALLNSRELVADIPAARSAEVES